MKFIRLILIFTLLLLVTGCGGEPPKPAGSSAPPPKPAPAAPPPVGAPPAVPNDREVCPRAGIGDRKERFAKDYAGEAKNAGNTSYDNGKYVVVFIEGRAFNITAAAVEGNKMEPNLVNMVPADATLTEEEERQEDRKITRINRYTSKALSEACPKSGGKFEVFEVHDKQSGLYLETIIACQIELPKGKGNEKSETETLMDQK
ncbi:MAG: hypothetical protein IJS96_04230 [Schwartzia sp.]|nr:hypothetical protein [Schwartzia sp. (in: firmicutes)]